MPPGCCRLTLGAGAAAALPPAPPLPLPPRLPPPRPWPACCQRHSGCGSGVSRRTGWLQRTAASQEARGGAPDAQQQGAEEGAAGGGGGAAAGGWKGGLHTSDRWVVQACRAAVRFLATLGARLYAWLASERSRNLATAQAWEEEMPALVSQLRYPSLGLVARRTAQVLGVVALLVAYVVAVDSLCAQVPRAIGWANAHPGWLRGMLSTLLAAARQRLAGTA